MVLLNFYVYYIILINLKIWAEKFVIRIKFYIFINTFKHKQFMKHEKENENKKKKSISEFFLNKRNTQ